MGKRSRRSEISSSGEVKDCVWTTISGVQAFTLSAVFFLVCPATGLVAAADFGLGFLGPAIFLVADTLSCEGDIYLQCGWNSTIRSVTHLLNEWRYDQWSATLESLHPEDQALWRITKRLMRVPTLSSPLVTPGGFALSDSEKAESPCRQSGNSGSAGDRSFGPGSY